MSETATAPQILKALRERAGLSMKQIALAMGYRGASSYQRYEAPDAYGDGLPLPMMRKIAAVLHGKGEPPISMADLAPLAFGQSPEFTSAHQVAAVYELLGLKMPAEVAEAAQVAPQAVKETPVVGYVQASYWVPSDPAVDEPLEWLAMPWLPRDGEGEQYALKVVGPSMNKLVAEGNYAVCRRYGGSPKSLKDNLVIHAERERDGEFEWTLKRVRWSAEGLLLWPESDDPRFQQPVAFDPDGNGDVRVSVKGIVVGYYRPAE